MKRSKNIWKNMLARYKITESSKKNIDEVKIRSRAQNR